MDGPCDSVQHHHACYMSVVSDDCCCQELNLSRTSITNIGMGLLAKGCPFLSFLDVSFCRVGDDGAIAVAEGCANLSHLALKHTQVHAL